MTLFHAPQSPYARKVRIAAIELGLAERIELVYTEVVPGNPNREFAKLNPLRKVPALRTAAGVILVDSLVICDYLDGLAGGGRLIPTDLNRRAQVMTDHALAQGLTDAALLIRYETWLRPEALRWPTWIDDQWQRIEAGLDAFESKIGAPGAPPQIDQIALGALLSYLDFRFPDHPWAPRRPALQQFQEAISQRASFRATIPVAPAGGTLSAVPWQR